MTAVLAGGRAPTILRSLPLLFLIAGQNLRGQAGVTEGNLTISVNVDLVVLHATVRDKQGGFVSGLERGAFHVFEDGVPQTIRLFQHEDVPVAVGLIVDNSGSMGPKKKDVTAAALTFARSSNPKDEMFVVNFNERVSLGLPNTEVFSASTSELQHALNGIPANGKTALYDAIEAGLAQLKKATLDKKVLVVISDGGDNASHHTLSQVLASIARSDTIIYTIGLFDEYDEDRNPGVLKKIAWASGGEAFLPNETSQVVQICRRIAEDIRNQYTIGYLPSNQTLDGAYRTIRVTATGANGVRLPVRTREGYVALPKEKDGAAGSQGKLR
jgi:Ca-activated chloride channel homolog